MATRATCLLVYTILYKEVSAAYFMIRMFLYLTNTFFDVPSE